MTASPPHSDRPFDPLLARLNAEERADAEAARNEQDPDRAALREFARHLFKKEND